MTQPTVSPDDRRRLRRQAEAAAAHTNHDEGDHAWRATVAAWADEQRRSAGRPALAPWWATKTETRFHERARALGLLD